MKRAMSVRAKYSVPLPLKHRLAIRICVSTNKAPAIRQVRLKKKPTASSLIRSVGCNRRRVTLKSLGTLVVLALSVAGCSSAAVDPDQGCERVFLQPGQPAVTYQRYGPDGVTRHVLQHEVPAAGPELMNDC